jgi:hypothetical protein
MCVCGGVGDYFNWAGHRLQFWGCAERKLALGDVKKNLADLKSLESPPMDESVTRKIWSLLNMNCPEDPLVEAVSLFKHIGWSSTTVEQQHASATLVRRQHKKYGAQQLCTRAALHTARLFYTIDPVLEEEQKLQRKLREQLDKTSARIPGNAVLFKKMCDIQAHRPKPRVVADTPTGMSHQQMLKMCGLANKKYESLTVGQREELRAAGRIEQAKRANANAEAAMETERAILEHRLKQKLLAMKGLPPRMIFSSCRFTDQDEQSMMQLYHSGMFSKNAVQIKRAAALRHGLLSEAQLARLSTVPLIEKEHPAEPWWLGVIANCRDCFRNTVVIICRGDTARYYRFLYAKKAPRGAVFCPLLLGEPEYTRVLGLAEHIGREEPVIWKYTFSCERMNTIEAWQIDSDPASTVYVLPGLTDLGASLVTDGPRYILSEFVRGHPGLGKRSTGTTAGPRAQRTPAQKAEWLRLLAQYPWLAQTAASTTRAKKARITGPTDSLADEESGEEDELAALDEEIEEILDEEGLLSIFSDLAAMREDWSVRYSSMVLGDFRTGLLGGASTYKATGSKGKAAVVADFVCCKVDGAVAKDFVWAYGLQKSKRACIRTYELGPATVLVEGWGHKMQYYLDCYLTSGSPRYSFVAADHEAYQEPANFTALAADDNKAVQSVVESIRAVRPFLHKKKR